MTTTLKWRITAETVYVRDFDDDLAEQLLEDPEALAGYETADTIHEDYVTERELVNDLTE